jgi:CheY-specific phosphatase CheX
METAETMERMMAASIFEVIEKMFFISLESGDFEQMAYGSASVVRFQGTLNGRMGLFLTRSMAQTMATNMLCVPAHPVRDEVLEDCTQEAAEMICGTFLCKADPLGASRLSLPVFYGDAAPALKEVTSPPDGLESRLGFDGGMEKMGIIIRLLP